jgi:hypothetical protein
MSGRTDTLHTRYDEGGGGSLRFYTTKESVWHTF